MEHAEQRLVLIVSDEPTWSRAFIHPASREGWRAVVVAYADALAAASGNQKLPLCALIVDCGNAALLPTAVAAIERLHRARPTLPFLALVEQASADAATQLLRAGACDYLFKPAAPEALLQALRSATTPDALPTPLRPLSEKPKSASGFAAMIGAAPGFRNALAIAAKAARGHAPVLIQGECGTGKEMMARAMHAAGPRARGPLQRVQIGASPENAIGSILFGHRKGAFPGAFDQQAGAIERCDGGTLVLSEFDLLPLAGQQRLLTAINEQECRPLGARHGFSVDVRYIFTTNAPDQAAAQSGEFLGQLSRIIAPVSITLPPLRARGGDIAALARHFLALLAGELASRPLSLTQEALALLSAYSWPANVRQLQAVLLRAALLCKTDALTPDDFASIPRPTRARATPPRDLQSIMPFATDGNLRSLEDIEGDIIRLAVSHYRGCMSEVARRLGIGRSTLYRKLSELGIDHPG